MNIIKNTRNMIFEKKKNGTSNLIGGTHSSIFLVIIILIIGFQCLYAGEIITLPDNVGKPKKMLAYEELFFIVDKTTIHIFSFPELKYIRSFGTKGRGPGEFLYIDAIYVENNQLITSTAFEVNIFTLEGKFIKRLQTNQRIVGFVPFKNKYVGWGSMEESGKRYVRFCLIDSTLENAVNIYKFPSIVFQKKVPYLTYKDYTIVINDKVYINTPEGKVHCFDINGKKVKTIDPGIKAVPITKAYAEKILRYYKTSKLGKMILQMHGDRLYMSTHCPYIYSMKKDQGHLLVKTYEKKNGYRKVKILDKDGRLIATRGIPRKSKTDGIAFTSVRTIYQNKLYQLADNYEEETWEIHVSPLVDWKDVK